MQRNQKDRLDRTPESYSQCVGVLDVSFQNFERILERLPHRCKDHKQCKSSKIQFKNQNQSPNLFPSIAPKTLILSLLAFPSPSLSLSPVFVALQKRRPETATAQSDASFGATCHDQRQRVQIRIVKRLLLISPSVRAPEFSPHGLLVAGFSISVPLVTPNL